MINRFKVRPIYIPPILSSVYPNLSVSAKLQIFYKYFEAPISQNGTVIVLPEQLSMKDLKRQWIDLNIKNGENHVTYTTADFGRTFDISQGCVDIALICTDATVPRLRYWPYPMFTFQIFDAKSVRNILRTNYSDSRDLMDLAPYWHQYIKDADTILDSWDEFDESAKSAKSTKSTKSTGSKHV
jgi:hypothetical protein